MKRIIAVFLLVVCVCGFNSVVLAEGKSKADVAAFINDALNSTPIDGVKQLVSYNEDSDKFLLMFGSLDIAMQGYYAVIGEENGWEEFKGAAYRYLTLADRFAEMFGYPGADISVMYYYTNDKNEVSVFYIVERVDGEITVVDTFTFDTEPVILEDEE